MARELGISRPTADRIAKDVRTQILGVETESLKTEAQKFTRLHPQILRCAEECLNDPKAPTDAKVKWAALVCKIPRLATDKLQVSGEVKHTHTQTWEERAPQLQHGLAQLGYTVQTPPQDYGTPANT